EKGSDARNNTGGDMFVSLWWRFWGCPRSVEAAALDFLHRRNGPWVRATLASRETWGMATTTDFARRIAYAYGLGSVKSVDWRTGQEVWSAGWNWRLLRDCGSPTNPRVAAEHILDRVCQLARMLLNDQRSDTECGHPARLSG